ncbi:hypothetical protein BP5796_02016 [Coleophoma crateriformis]|uniref:Peptidase S33 tripeptidyl aminopeptidase-like C-terminal domain-containing protein n=1 Tax=Coleophoma crateriformis TaxID=565419 RepID=A0A3D8T225_9HELO|nr:hypothetical protein BP5796_02016 [Coleophoma crateriformis]
MTDYRGPVFMNPGGPGGSGVFMLIDHGRSLQAIVGKNHDIISWDPRGVGASTPSIDCWSSKQRAQLWSIQAPGVIDSHPGVLYDAFSHAVATSQACAAAMPGPNSLLKFVSTASAARDMLEILDKMGWSRLKYWGFSYGTVLGVTFASMYPERVERMVNDGNVDVVDWTSDGHIHFLADADKVMGAFWKFCHLAGPKGCALYESNPEMIEKRFQNVLNDLRMHPVIVAQAANSPDLPELVTYSSLKRLISAALYRPVLLYPKLASVVASLEAGNGRPFMDLVTAYGMRQPFSCSCEIGGDPGDLEGTDDAFAGIMCSDSGIRIESVEKFESYAKYMMEVSKASGAVNVLFEMSCAGWQIRPKWRYNGPFQGNTTHPILFIANIADNVTPLRSARMNAQGFNGSVVLVQQSYGHTSLTAPSFCTASHIRAYFNDGTVPEPGIECSADIDPFQDLDNLRIMREGGDMELANALYNLTTSFSIRPFAGHL